MKGEGHREEKPVESMRQCRVVLSKPPGLPTPHPGTEPGPVPVMVLTTGHLVVRDGETEREDAELSYSE